MKTLAFRSSFPARASCLTTAAVIGFSQLAMAIGLFGCMGTLPNRSLDPYPLAMITTPWREMDSSAEVQPIFVPYFSITASKSWISRMVLPRTGGGLGRSRRFEPERGARREFAVFMSRAGQELAIPDLEEMLWERKRCQGDPALLVIS